MIKCDEICDLLPEYTGGGLEQKLRCDIAVHLSTCENCRKETAMLFKLKYAQKSLSHELPENVRLNAFRLIRDEKVETERNSLLETIFGAFDITRSAIRLTCKLIKI